MIAACPKCNARYRIERERLSAEGVRLRCQRCEAVFRVRAPVAEAVAAAAHSAPHAVSAASGAEARQGSQAPAASARPSVASTAPAPAPVAAPPPAAARVRVLVAAPDADVAKEAASLLTARGLEPIVVHDGVEGMLEIQRKLPRVAVLWASLPRMFGFQICEIVKRNESLRTIGVVLVGEIHDSGRYRRPPPGDLYGADSYIEEPDMPDGLLPLLEQLGVPVARASRADVERPGVARPVAPAGGATPSAPPPPVALALAPAPTPVAAPPVRPVAPPPAAPAAAVAATSLAPGRAVADDAAPRNDGLDEQRAQAARLARIIVSDIVLYNETRFLDALGRGNVLASLEGELAEGRALFRERIDERVRAERDHLADELLRVARSRGMAG